MLQEKYSSVRILLDEHNKALGYDSENPEEKPNGFVNSDEFITSIKAIGGTTVDRLKKFSYEDILECLPAHGNVKPKVLAKEIAQIFRGNKDEDSSPQNNHSPRPVSAKKADRMSPKELVEHFDPEDPHNPVGQRLMSISRGEPFIVYETGRTVDVVTTTKLLLELKSGFPEGRKTVTVGNEIKPVYVIGYLPEHYVDENPIYIGRPLRPDGTCDQLNRSWDGVELEVRQFIRVGINLNTLIVSRDKAHDYLDWALKVDALTYLRNRYPEVSVAFDRLKKEGNLPSLQIELSNPYAVEVGHPARPFDNGKKVQWVQHVTPQGYKYCETTDQYCRRMSNMAHSNKNGGTMSSGIARKADNNPWNGQ